MILSLGMVLRTGVLIIESTEVVQLIMNAPHITPLMTSTGLDGLSLPQYYVPYNEFPTGHLILNL